ncbi:MAG: tRNA (adenosine(37)-N6)-threonylcarbamoyltransferase complex ATPase subunit type 1 TsaE [Dehalococcoidia bacterium]|nr:tRNA (adenosine(37)-N6)-threonylcarbamoyltransferase complex ATPase subunit type 1 TsaE [Dehalococcoidia bacterium]
MSFELVTAGPEQTFRAGEGLAPLLVAGDVVLLEGPLGAGKTRFTQGLAKGLGIAQPLTSPTFVLMNEYQGRLMLYHIDLYRIEAEAEAVELGLDDYFFGDGVCVVEWPDRAPSAMPAGHLLIRLEHASESSRCLTFAAAGPRAEALLPEYMQALVAGAVPSRGGVSDG